MSSRAKSRDTKKNIVLSSLSLACLILTHNLTALIFLPFLLVYLLFLVISQKSHDRIPTIKNYLASLFLSFGLSAYFILPSLFEKSYTLVDKILTEELADFRLHFVALRQLVNSPWGYGGSVPGPFDDMSFEIGKLHLLFIIISLIITVILIIKKHPKQQILFLFSVFFAISLIMTVTISLPIWEILKPLWYLQFPWRFLGPVSFFASLLIGGLVLIIKNKKIRIFTASILAILTIFFYKNLFVPQRYVDINDSHYNSKEGLQWEVSRMSYEYVPSQVKTTKTLLGTTILAITKKDLPQEKVSFLKGSGEMTKQTIKSQSYDLTLNITSQADIRLATYYFPGWQATLNGQQISIDTNNDLHLITITNIPPGQHNLVVQFENMPIRNLGNLTSTISLLIILFIIFSPRLKKFIK